MFRSLRTLSGIPRLRTLLPLSLIARIHLSALPISLAFLLTGWAGSYTAVGLVSAMIALGQAVAGPVRGRVADRGSASRLLFVTGGSYAVGLAALVLATVVLPGRFWPLTSVISFFTGLMLPPISQISRALWPRMAQGEARRALYTLDATGYEVVAIVGPLLAAGIVTVASGTAAVIVCGVLAVGGAVSFGMVLRATGLDRNESRPHPEPAGAAPERRSLLRDTTFLRAVLVPFFLMTALFAANLSVVAWARDRGTPSLAGVLGALLSAGSVIGGIIAVGRGGRPRGVLSIGGVAVGLGAAAVLLPPFSTGTPAWPLSIVMVVTGTAVAPSFSASYARVGEVAPEDRQAEAYGWLATATTCGAGVALPVVGRLLDIEGPSAGALAGAVSALLSALLVLSLPRTVPEPEPVADPQTTDAG